MKKLLMLLTLLTMSFMVGAANNMVKETVEYKIYALGVVNPRVYEWTPLDNPNIRCLYISDISGRSGVTCYPVEKQ